MKHKWLEGIDICAYPDNHFRIKRFREYIQHIKYVLKKRKTGVDPRDCWSLDTWYYEWLYEHIKQYIHDARDIVDLEYHKFEYKGKEYTQLELMNLLCQELIRMLKWDEFEGTPELHLNSTEVAVDDISIPADDITDEENERFMKAVKENYDKKLELRDNIFEMWKILIDAMWW